MHHKADRNEFLSAYSGKLSILCSFPMQAQVVGLVGLVGWVTSASKQQ